MKKILIVLLLISVGSSFLYGQNIGINTTTPDASAKLDVSSTNSGILIPRLSNTERANIDLSQTPESLMIFNTTDKCFQIYIDGDWRNIWCLDCNVTIGTHPQAATLCTGTEHTLSVVASGTVLSYQWEKDDADISGATNSTYTISSAGSSDAADYKVRVIGRCDSVTSNEVTIAVNAAQITTNPSDVSVAAGGNATFTIATSGSGLTYQWQEKQGTDAAWADITNGGIYSNATTISLTLTGVTSGMTSYQYRCVVGTTCTGVSLAGKLTVTN